MSFYSGVLVSYLFMPYSFKPLSGHLLMALFFMTKFDSNMERDINRCAVALEKLTKLVTLQNEVIELLAEKKPAPKPARRKKNET